MRTLTRSVLGILNPEDTFEKADYYRFIQSLFKDNLYELRQDVTVLSFNYDPYLEYLLLRALVQRNKVAGVKLTGDFQNAVTSGFLSLTERDWFEDDQKHGDAFCLLKLHGVMCPPNLPRQIDGKMLFTDLAEKRLGMLFHPTIPDDQPTPIIFPWELIADELDFVKPDAFPLATASPAYFDLFRRFGSARNERWVAPTRFFSWGCRCVRYSTSASSTCSPAKRGRCISL